MNFLRLGQKEYSLTISGVNAADYAIVVHGGETKSGKGPIEASANVQKAARELQKYIALITGVSLPVLSDQNPLIRVNEILIGYTIRPESAIYDRDYSDDGYLIKTTGRKLIIDGGRRGVLYGVYTFLEKYLSVRFFAPDVERILDAEKITVDEINERFEPPFEYREICYWNAWDSDFSVKNKINGAFVRILGEEWGGGITYAGGFGGLVHTFSRLLPEKHFAAHPEYFALKENGMRDPSGLCLTNDGAFQTVLKNARKWVKASPKGYMLSVSINDGDVAYCTCSACSKIKTEEKGGESGPVLRFVNRVAEALEPEFPGLLIDTIIYGRVQDPPAVTRPNRNIILRICSDTYRNAAYGANVTQHKEFEERLDKWAAVCDKIYVWDYPAPYMYINSVFPNFHTLLPNIKYFKERNVKGVYINGNTETAQFSELTVYLLAKALWNPDMQETVFDAHMDEFLAGFYGKGWRHIKAFIDYTRELAGGRAFECNAPPEEKIPYSPETVNKMRGFFIAAENESESAAEKHRIEKAALQVEYFDLFVSMANEYSKGNENERAALSIRNRALYEGLQKHGITRINENCFLPVVRDFRQPPAEWGYWDFTPGLEWGDANILNYDRNIYAIIESDLEIGAETDISFLLRTNNSNPACFGRAASKSGNSYIEDGNGRKIPLVWNIFKEYKRVTIKNAVVTDLKLFAKSENKLPKDRDYEFIPPYKKGFIICLESISAGAYFMIREFKKRLK